MNPVTATSKKTNVIYALCMDIQCTCIHIQTNHNIQLLYNNQCSNSWLGSQSSSHSSLKNVSIFQSSHSTTKQKRPLKVIKFIVLVSHIFTFCFKTWNESEWENVKYNIIYIFVHILSLLFSLVVRSHKTQQTVKQSQIKLYCAC